MRTRYTTTMRYFHPFLQPSLAESAEGSPAPKLMPRLLIAGLIGLLSGLIAYWFRLREAPYVDAGDFSRALFTAKDILAGRSPYDHYTFSIWNVPYPLPAGFVALPFVGLPPAITAALFFGLSSALLAFGISRGGYARLLLFTTAPYVAAMSITQWSPLVTAAAFYWPLAFLVLVKPQIALPVVLTHWRWRNLLVIGAVGIASLIIMPTWPWEWIRNLGPFQSYVPLLVFPGSLLLLALLRYRSRNAWLLVLMAIMPQRAMYDTVALWLIPRTRRELMVTVAFSWVAFWLTQLMTDANRAIVLGIYLPMLVVVLRREPVPAALQRLTATWRLRVPQLANYTTSRGTDAHPDAE